MCCKNWVLIPFVGAACILLITLCSGACARYHTSGYNPVGTWQIDAATTHRDGIAADLFRGFASPLIGAKICSYQEGMAELSLPDGRKSIGYVFCNKTPGEVRFLFNEAMPGTFDCLDLPCRFQSANVLVAEDEASTITLKRIGSVPDELPLHMRTALGLREGVEANLEEQLKQNQRKQDGATSSDGRAFLPGVQGK